MATAADVITVSASNGSCGRAASDQTTMKRTMMPKRRSAWLDCGSRRRSVLLKCDSIVDDHRGRSASGLKESEADRFALGLEHALDRPTVVTRDPLCSRVLYDHEGTTDHQGCPGPLEGALQHGANSRKPPMRCLASAMEVKRGRQETEEPHGDQAGHDPRRGEGERERAQPLAQRTGKPALRSASRVADRDRLIAVLQRGAEITDGGHDITVVLAKPLCRSAELKKVRLPYEFEREMRLRP